MQLAGVAVLVLLGVIVALGLWLARRERYRFDHQARSVERDGKQICRYEEVERVLIDIGKEDGESVYRVKLSLRGGQAIPISEKIAEKVLANKTAYPIASEIGVVVRVMD
ncbi:MAG: hypothetical protein EXR33_10035 [Betaproteobacteria bacterium]|nr:hypothetical protein [Betaproteobacteria bacterium]